MESLPNPDYSRSVIGRYCECLYKLIIGTNANTDSKVDELAVKVLSSSHQNRPEASMHGEEIWEEIDLSSDNDPIPNETNVNKPTTAKIDVIAQNIFSPLHITCSEGLKHEYERSSDELARMVTIDYGSDSDISDISDSSDPYPWSSHIN